MRSTFRRARSRRWPWTSLAGKQTVSEVTADRPSSYRGRVLLPDSWTRKPRLRQKAFQKGMVSQKERTRGMPMVTPRLGARAGAS